MAAMQQGLAQLPEPSGERQEVSGRDSVYSIEERDESGGGSTDAIADAAMDENSLFVEWVILRWP